MRRGPGALVAALAAALLASGCSASAPDAAATTIRIEMRDSRFTPTAVTVPAARPVRFVLVNTDPIDHEFILGDEAEQERHERGTHASHDGTPGAASLAPGETQEIVTTFARAGVTLFGCHLPGHYAYGMRGSVRIVAA